MSTGEGFQDIEMKCKLVFFPFFSLSTLCAETSEKHILSQLFLFRLNDRRRLLAFVPLSYFCLFNL